VVNALKMLKTLFSVHVLGYKKVLSLFIDFSPRRSRAFLPPKRQMVECSMVHIHHGWLMFLHSAGVWGLRKKLKTDNSWICARAALW
jgi:hypothetical protein